MQKNNILVALSTLVMALVMCFTLVPSVARAEEYPTYTYTDNNGTLTLANNATGYLLISGIHGEFTLSGDNSPYGFDQYGTAWFIHPVDNTIAGWNYYLQYNELMVYRNYIFDDDGNYIIDAESLVFDENDEYVIGYRTFSGQVYSLLTYEEIEENASSNIKKKPEASPLPSPTVAPTPTPNQQVTPGAPAVVNPTSTPGTVQPNNGEEPQVNSTKITLKKKGNTTSLYKGNTVVSKFTLKKGVLKYKGRTYKNVKSAGFIKKSQNLIFMNKKGKVFTINAKGKKKTILKKNAKKLVFKSGYVTKVKKKSGSLNVAGK